MTGLPNLRLLLGGAVAAAVLSGAAYIKGRWDGAALADAVHAASAIQAAQQVRKTERRADAITLDIQAQHSAALAEIIVVKQIVSREVPRYVTVKADAACLVPTGFVSLHDAATRGAVPKLPGAAGGPDDPSGVALSTVASTVAGNYSTCHETAARLTALQEWVQRQKGSTSQSK